MMENLNLHTFVVKFESSRVQFSPLITHHTVCELEPAEVIFWLVYLSG